MKNLTIILLTFFSFSCAPLGTRTKNFNSIEKSSINEIAIVISEINWLDKNFGKYVDSLFINNLISSIELKLNVKATYVGFADGIIIQRDKFLNENPNFDAIIHCEIELMGMLTLDNSNRYNSRVRTQLFKIPEKALIAQTNFNTNLGKSYWRHPLLELAIRDGVDGAIIPYNKVLK
jgi:hypothetical protein